MKTFYTPDFRGATLAVIDANMFALTSAILTQMGVRRVRDLKSEHEFATLITQLGLNVAKDGLMKQQKPLELKHVLGFCLYVVITIALITYQHADKIAAYVKGLKIL